ncbi:hypothetical protein F2P81_002512 [Scophthalmus maximus]|uniref:Uncharacterized protein n=1 Tax=Scophthalmus maximus TaxID=52904 RepID=A0A6A4TIZ9_SCOMX|nr:hypothetical protein F2P81_002512 [Scophthalmus maximus]
MRFSTQRSPQFDRFKYWRWNINVKHAIDESVELLHRGVSRSDVASGDERSGSFRTRLRPPDHYRNLCGRRKPRENRG